MQEQGTQVFSIKSVPHFQDNVAEWPVISRQQLQVFRIGKTKL